ncbi:MAG TPA: homogentisate 1,2-dioxygenase [Pirellulaceae bacterium]|nr:homogentisate 1,2-dioxygenase [Pirellulaceae bacterium]
MPSYRKLGQLPPKRHIQMHREQDSFLGENLHYEHVVTTQGFDRAYSIMYHLRPPTRVLTTEAAGQIPLRKLEERELRHHHIKTQQLPRRGDPILGRIPMMFNDDLVAWRAKPAEPQTELYRNGAADEVIFIHQGSGYLETIYGKLPYRRGDYVVVPRTTTYRMVADDVTREDHLILETFSQVRVPARYQNPDGQMYLGVPYYERDFHSPTELVTIDRELPTVTLIKNRDQLTRVTMPHHPFDVVGWDGFLYPYTFNAWDFEPLTGTVHLPPPFQQTFECRGFVICTFAPRHLDHHPRAVKVPYVHSNVEADEVLFYVDGEFGSRRGVELGSMTLHPGGIPHGPHPGTIVKSMSMNRTEEMAVMFDTDRRLHLTLDAMELDDPSYPQSWLENPNPPPTGQFSG